jgi:hypothetical protein
VETNRYDQIFCCGLMRTALANVVRQYPCEWLGRNSKLTLVRNPSLLHIMATDKSSFLHLFPRRSSRIRDYSCTGLLATSRQPAAERHQRAALSNTEIAAGAPTSRRRNSYVLHKRRFHYPEDRSL